MILTVDNEKAGMRIDAYLAEVTSESRSSLAKLCERGLVTVNGTPCEKKRIISEGDTIFIDIPEAEEYEVKAENIPIDIIFEDSDIAVINKRSGMVVHPAPGNYSGTLVNALLYHLKDSLSGVGGVLRPGIVHRIDKDTSGLLVIAKNDFAHRALSAELEHHGIEREYHALVRGGFKDECGTVNLPIGRHSVDRKKMAVLPLSQNAKEAITHYEVLRRYGQITYLKLNLETGRTHQIRVHMSYTGHPLLGDEVYSSNKTLFEKRHAPLFDGQILHAKKLSFRHPRTGEQVSFECELPENFKQLLSILNKENE